MKISDAYHIPADQIKAMIAAEDLNADILVGKALKLVRENAKIGAPKAKKTTAKKTAKAEDGEAPKKTTAKKTAAKKTEKASDAE